MFDMLTTPLQQGTAANWAGSATTTTQWKTEALKALGKKSFMLTTLHDLIIYGSSIISISYSFWRGCKIKLKSNQLSVLYLF